MTAPAQDRAAVAPPPAHTVSILPAAVVLGIAVLTLFIFAFINVLDSPSTTPTTLPVILGGLQVGSHDVFAGFRVAGDPPADIGSALFSPAGTARIGAVVTGGGGAGNYDQAVRLSVRAQRAQVLGFYRSHLEALGWSLYSTSTTAGARAQLLFQKAGSDSWYWEVGIVASRTAGGATGFTYRLFQASDFT